MASIHNGTRVVLTRIAFAVPIKRLMTDMPPHAIDLVNTPTCVADAEARVRDSMQSEKCEPGR